MCTSEVESQYVYSFPVPDDSLIRLCATIRGQCMQRYKHWILVTYVR